MSTEESPDKPFDLDRFLPYLLNQAAEATSRSFHALYKSEYGMTRTQWRVLANLGRFGEMTARDICRISHVEKTKVSRAVSAIEAHGWLARRRHADDRRAELLMLTPEGQGVFARLGELANGYDASLRAALGSRDAGRLEAMLRRLVAEQPADADID
ncbi:MarR family winged helix-turn-helix transcriptional regulator [Ancylobacter terrae]|uniref:MarR family winged helix-turn-helix transcriptional regulator n=1 Tax=Ancylobacter sp. sgz301288 TaxID=3342077 RepID=UPI00385C534A